jgi:hypothetical protein
MNTPLVRSILRAVLVIPFLVGSMLTAGWAQSANSYENRIVGVFDVQVTLYNCDTGAPFASFRGLNKFELGGTAQVVPATNPTALSAHVGIWNHLQGNNYQLAFKMFRFDGAGNNIGWQIVRFDLAINDGATLYAGSGLAKVYDSNGNLIGRSCPTIAGTRFE